MNTFGSKKLRRRLFLKLLGGSIPASIVLQHAFASAGEKKTVRIVEFDPSGARTRVVEVEKIE
jgi:hypothetical protein